MTIGSTKATEELYIVPIALRIGFNEYRYDNATVLRVYYNEFLS